MRVQVGRWKYLLSNIDHDARVLDLHGEELVPGAVEDVPLLLPAARDGHGKPEELELLEGGLRAAVLLVALQDAPDAADDDVLSHRGRRADRVDRENVLLELK